MKHVDVVISGGGMVGLPLGLALAQGGFKTLVADGAAPARVLEPKFDGRVSALAYASVRMLSALGVWEGLAPDAQPIHEILVSDGAVGRPASPFSLHFDAEEIGAKALGHLAENRHIRAALYEVVARTPNLELVAPAVVKSFAVESGGATVTLADGEEITCALVIAADGRDSRLRNDTGIGVIGWSYPQTGIVATVEHEQPHNGVAYEHFLPSGPFAILPMTGNRSSIVWTEDAALAPHIVKLPDAEFAAELQARFGDFLGAIEPVGPRWTYPLSLMQAERYTARRLALIGEAAHVIHPIAGQGLNVGIRDCAALAEAVIDARRLGLDIGDDSVLERYQRWRRLDAVLLAGVTDGLNRLFSNRIAPLKLARDLGLAAVNRMPPLKRLLMQHAMGTLGDRPRLARGEPL